MLDRKPGSSIVTRDTAHIALAPITGNTVNMPNNQFVMEGKCQLGIQWMNLYFVKYSFNFKSIVCSRAYTNFPSYSSAWILDGPLVPLVWSLSMHRKAFSLPQKVDLIGICNIWLNAKTIYTHTFHQTTHYGQFSS